MRKLLCALLVSAVLITSCAAALTREKASQLAELSDRKMTLGEFASYCVHTFDLNGQEPAENPYSDLNAGSAEGVNILRLTARGAIKGHPDGTVHPEEVITVTRAYTILTRLTAAEAEPPKLLNLPPDVTPAMCSADFWLAQVPDCGKVLMDPDEIEALNRRMLDCEETCMNDLDSITEYKGSIVPQIAEFETPSLHYFWDIPAEEAYYESLRENARLPQLPESNPVSYGFAVRQTVLRSIPTLDALTSQLAVPEEDDFALSGVYPNDPVVLYHTTKDGKLTYAVTSDCSGWIPTEDIAICESREQWLAFRHPEKFLTVTGDRVCLEPSGDEFLSEKLLPMGTILPLVTEPSERVIWRSPMNNYVVQLAARDENGKFFAKNALLPFNRNVCEGFLPYTTANILKTAFACLGDRYSWGGGIHGTDCSQYVQVVYRCFGLRLPRNTTWQSKIPTESSLDWTDATPEQKKADLGTLRPGTILIFNGHEMLYLGKYNEKYYVISNVGKFVDPNAPENGTINVYGIVMNDLSYLRANGSTWLESLNHATVIP